MSSVVKRAAAAAVIQSYSITLDAGLHVHVKMTGCKHPLTADMATPGVDPAAASSIVGNLDNDATVTAYGSLQGHYIAACNVGLLVDGEKFTR